MAFRKHRHREMYTIEDTHQRDPIPPLVASNSSNSHCSEISFSPRNALSPRHSRDLSDDYDNQDVIKGAQLLRAQLLGISSPRQSFRKSPPSYRGRRYENIKQDENMTSDELLMVLSKDEEQLKRQRTISSLMQKQMKIESIIQSQSPPGGKSIPKQVVAEKTNGRDTQKKYGTDRQCKRSDSPVDKIEFVSPPRQVIADRNPQDLREKSRTERRSKRNTSNEMDFTHTAGASTGDGIEFPSSSVNRSHERSQSAPKVDSILSDLQNLNMAGSMNVRTHQPNHGRVQKRTPSRNQRGAKPETPPCPVISTSPVQKSHCRTQSLPEPPPVTIRRRSRSDSAANQSERTEAPSSALQRHRELSKNPAYLHAQSAGGLWQTLVGEFVKFPRTWFDGARAPPVGDVDTDRRRAQKWKFVSSSLVKGSSIFNSIVADKRSPGKLLLHVIVRDANDWDVSMDVVIGTFHPKAKGVNICNDDEMRVVWMAVRKRLLDGNADEVSVMERQLTCGKCVKDVGRESPLGDKKGVGNENIRAIFGDEPPMETVIIMDTELCETMEQHQEDYSANGNIPPANIMLQEYLFK